MRLALLVAAAVLPVVAHGAACSARSPAHTTAFVELYTSEGCNSCPSADRWLSGIAKSYSPEQVVPLALPLDYWDYIGWKDPRARREFSQRQRRLSQLQRVALIPRPQVVLQGADFRAWGSREFDRAVERINARPATAHLSLAVVGLSEAALQVKVDARTNTGTVAGVYLAAYERGLTRLPHDYLALEWRGPFGLGGYEVEIPLLPRARAADSGVAAFVQDGRTGQVLQALMLGVCFPSGVE